MLFVLVILALVALSARACRLDDPALIDWAKRRLEKLGNCSALSGGYEPVTYNVPNVKIVAYHNDEHEVMADFLQYNAFVFGASNIVVIDQNSQIMSICKTLALFQRCGTEVVTTDSSFLDKGKSLTSAMLKYNNTLLIPLDTDEFILPLPRETSHTVMIDRDALWNAFKALPVDGRKYKFQTYSAAMPNLSVCEESIHEEDAEFRRAVSNDMYHVQYHAIPRSKTFFHSNGFIATDDGNHYGRVKHDNDVLNADPRIEANMTHYFAILHAQMLHFTIGSYRGAKDKYTRASVNMGYTGDTDCSIGRVGIQYCVPCKLFINGSDHGAKYYTDSCKSPPHARNIWLVSDWFKTRAKSLFQLTGFSVFDKI